MKSKNKYPVEKTQEQWRELLPADAYHVLREKGTEAPGSGRYHLFFEKGTYKCRACQEKLFSSSNKFDAGCGWPSFDQELLGEKITKQMDLSYGMQRTEILCANCGSHLGHLFNDGPSDTGLRYCVNSLSLDFDKDSTKN